MGSHDLIKEEDTTRKQQTTQELDIRHRYLSIIAEARSVAKPDHDCCNDRTRLRWHGVSNMRIQKQHIANVKD